MQAIASQSSASATSAPAASVTPYTLLTDRHRERFWRKVDTSAGADACWPFKGALESAGYGQLSVWLNGRAFTLKSHRLAWTFTHGPVPRDPSLRNGEHGTIVRHSCGTRRCCNPRHLILGTHLDSLRESRQHGRVSKAGRRGLLTTEQKATIATLVAGPSRPTQRELAARFGVNQPVIAYALRSLRKASTFSHPGAADV